MITQDQLNEIVKTTVTRLEELLVTKGNEYVVHQGDRLDNFRRNGTEIGVSMEVVWRIYAGKHWDAINTYIKDLGAGTVRDRSEPIEGRVDDLIVYLMLFKAMCVERSKMINSAQHETADDSHILTKEQWKEYIRLKQQQHFDKAWNKPAPAGWPLPDPNTSVQTSSATSESHVIIPGASDKLPNIAGQHFPKQSPEEIEAQRLANKTVCDPLVPRFSNPGTGPARPTEKLD